MYLDFELRGTLPRLCLLHRLSLGLTSYTMYMAFLSMGSSGTEEAALSIGVQLTIVACFTYNNIRAYLAASSVVFHIPISQPALHRWAGREKLRHSQSTGDRML